MYVYQITSLLELVRMRTLTMFSVILRCSNGSILPIDSNMVWRGKTTRDEQVSKCWFSL